MNAATAFVSSSSRPPSPNPIEGTDGVSSSSWSFFAAGMSGGIAYVLDEHGYFWQRCNKEMVQLTSIVDSDEIQLVYGLISRHAQYTASRRAQSILSAWEDWLRLFVKVIPNDYKRVLDAQNRVRAAGMSADQAAMAAFELNAHDQARVGGK